MFSSGCMKWLRKRWIKRQLHHIEYEDTQAFIPPITYAKVIKVYDGDTITVAARLHNDSKGIVYRFPVRFRGIDAPEMKGGSHIECQKAIVSRDALHSLIFGQIIELRNNGKEKYGRLLSDIYLDELHVNKWMLDQKYAVAYNGKGTKEDWSVA